MTGISSNTLNVIFTQAYTIALQRINEKHFLLSLIIPRIIIIVIVIILSLCLFVFVCVCFDALLIFYRLILLCVFVFNVIFVKCNTICLQHCLVKILGFNYSTWIIVCGKPLTFTNKFILEIILYNYTRFLYIILTLFFYSCILFYYFECQQLFYLNFLYKNPFPDFCLTLTAFLFCWIQ